MELLKNEKGIYLILTFTVIILGLNVVMMKYLTQYMPPMLVISIRTPLAAIVLLPFVWKKFGLFKPNVKQWGLLFLMGSTTYFLHQLFLVYGVVSTSATNTALIMALYPIFTAIFAFLFMGEQFNLKLACGILLGFSGVLLVITSKSGGSLSLTGRGDFIIFLAMLVYVFGCLAVKKLTETPIPNLVITAYSTLIGGVLLNLSAIFFFGTSLIHQIHFSPSIWTIMLISAWGASALGNLGWNHGIKFLGANKTAIFQNGMPLASMLGGVVFMDEKIGWIHLMSFILITLGIIIGTIKHRSGVLSSLKSKVVVLFSGKKG